MTSRRVKIRGFVVGLLIADTGTLGACASASAPGDVVKAFYGAVAADKVDEATKYLNLPAGMEAKAALVIAAQAAELKGGGGFDSVEIVKEEVNGDKARVTYRLHTKGGPGKAVQDMSENLVKVDGKWLISAN